ncbi:hypothetical protein [Nocardiopsis sp. CC223A]|uniref:hypothetical protein n=1 Tax=Nocardiopsis sp. CC223A TaxID=3044051 RepID=UPI00278C85A1|nr:hypothetical protein [Nocardiopsis sp. CC223A]
MRGWMVGGALVGSCVMAFLLLAPPPGQDRDGGRIVCAPLLGAAPSAQFTSEGDTQPDAWVNAHGRADHGYDRFELVVLCEQRRSARLVWTVLAAVPTTVLWALWGTTTIRARTG